MWRAAIRSCSASAIGERTSLPLQRDASGGQGFQRVLRDRPRILFQHFNRKPA